MNIVVGVAIATILFISMLVLLLIYGKLIAKNKESKARKFVQYGGIGITCLYCFVLLGLGSIYATSYIHGNQDPWLDIVTMEKYNATTPIENKLPQNLNGCTLIIYRYDCPSCHDIHADLVDKLKNQNKVYYVCSRSEQGKQIVEEYNVPEVPYGIYIPKSDNETLTRVSLSKSGSDGTQVVDDYNLNRLFRASRGESPYAIPDTPIPAEQIQPSPELQ